MLLIPNEGEVRLLNEVLDGGLARENWLLKLFTNDYTPTETDTSASYTEVNSGVETWYSAKTLTRTVGGTTWQTPASGSPTGSWSAEAAVGKSTYGSAPQSWTKNAGAGSLTIYGYFVVGATSGKVIFAERLAAPFTMTNGSTFSMTPVFEFA